MIKTIAILTSGGDAPGMNAAIRAIVRSARINGLDVYGIHEGYKGLVEGGEKFVLMGRKSVTNIIGLGGTILGSARLPEFKNIEVREKALENLKQHNVDALVVIGGDGTYQGALALKKMGFRVIGLPGTIDNDIFGTDYTIGFDTCLNTVVEAVDRLRDTCGSHQRCAVVEVMGRYCGDIAKSAGLATGAELVITSETGYEEEKVLANARAYREKGNRHPIIIVTEKITDVHKLAEKIEAETGIETRATILGHIQRGGNPTASDRILAGRLGNAAVEILLEGGNGVCVGIHSNQIVTTPFEEVLTNKKNIFAEYESLIRTLS